MLSSEDREAIQGAGQSVFPDGTYRVWVVSVDWLAPWKTGELSDTLQITIDVRVNSSLVARRRDRLRIRHKNPAAREIALKRAKSLFDSAGVDVKTMDEKELENQGVMAIFETRSWLNSAGEQVTAQEVSRYLSSAPEVTNSSMPSFPR